MFKNYFKIALRQLQRNRVHTFINIAGLAIGITATLLIMLFVFDEFRYDRFHENAGRIYRVTHTRTLKGTAEASANAPLALKPALAVDFPQFEATARLLRETALVVEYNQQAFVEKNFFFADPEIFKIFSFRFVLGAPATALQAANGLVITETIARKYFGEEDPIGKTVYYKKWGQRFPFQVTGVINDMPLNSHVSIDFFARFESEQNLWQMAHGKDWYHAGAWTYALLSGAATASEIEPLFANFVQKHFPPELRHGTALHLQPIANIHLHSHLLNELEANGNIVFIYIFSVIAALILLIACINFINLTTARSAIRAKEVGMRKTLGAERTSLIKQFIGEAFFLSTLATVLALLFVELALPTFNRLLGKQLALDILADPSILISLLGLSLLVGLLAGSYPALFLSRFNPVTALKGETAHGKGALSLRQVLVIGQFAVTIVLLVAVILVADQLDFIRSKNLGFRSEQILFVHKQPSIDYTTVKDGLALVPGVIEATGASGLPSSEIAPIRTELIRPEQLAQNERKQVHYLLVDSNFVKVFGLQIVDGRTFSPEMVTDETNAVLLNESAVAALGWQENPIGRQIEVYNMLGASDSTRQVIGVVKDFHFESLHEKIKPLVLTVRSPNQRRRGFAQVVLRLRADDIAGTVERLSEKWQELAPGWPFEFFFLEEDMAKLYFKEARVAQIVNSFATLAVLVSCLGLFGLASFTAEQRTKEIGIRKVLGASVANVTALLSKDFVKLVLLANLIAWPVAWLAMNLWLQNFAYRIDIGWPVFALAGGLALAIALLTVSTQAIKAALANPVDSLRYE